MICKIEGCGMKSHAFELCRKHHARFKRHGSTESKYDKSKYVELKGVKDTRPGARGYLAVNVINDIKYKAGKRGKNWELSHVEAFTLITSMCTYCSFTPLWPSSRVGIDRVNNEIGYEVNNCVSCCFTCNSAKGEKTLEEFKEWIVRVHAKLT